MWWKGRQWEVVVMDRAGWLPGSGEGQGGAGRPRGVKATGALEGGGRG